MVVHENPISGFDNRPVPHKAKVYPQPANPDLPRCYSLSLWVGSRGSGKTFKLVKLIKMYETEGLYYKGRLRDQRVILCCPTADANPVYTALKHLDLEDIHTNYTDQKLQEILDSVKHEKEESEKYQRRLKVWRRFVACKKTDNMSPDDLLELHGMGFEPPEKPRYPNGPAVTHLICDDLQGSSLFKSGLNPFVNLCLKNRHLGINVYIACQQIKGCNKSIRSNVSLFCLFRYGNQKMVQEDVYPEVSGLVTPEQFLELYEHATQNPHDALVIDFSMPRERRFKLNFEKVLTLENLTAPNDKPCLSATPTSSGSLKSAKQSKQPKQSIRTSTGI